MFGLKHGLMFAATCWLLWKQRNTFVFQGVFGQIKEITVAAKCMIQTIEVSSVGCGGIGVSSTLGTRWWPPDEGWIKVNTDGAAGTNYE